MRPTRIYEFGPFRLVPSERQLLRDGEPIQLAPKAFEVLVVLVRNGGHLVGKDELLKELWAGSFVEESNVSHNVYLLRKALGEETNGARYIETVPRKGYRFVAPVREVAPAGAVETVVGEQRTHVASEEESEGESDASERRARTAPAPAERPAKTRRAALAVALAVVACVTASLALWSRGVRRAAPGADGIKRVAVLPFKPLGEDSGDELLGLGIADAVINQLSPQQQFIVLPTSTVYKYTGRAHDPIAVGRELGVDAVLEGTVQRAGERVRVTAQLISLNDGETLWSEKFDAVYTDVFRLQDSISVRVARALAARIPGGGEAESVARRRAASTEAYQDYLLGVYHWNKRTPESLYKAVEYFSAATARDPAYAHAYAGMGDAYALIANFGYLPLAPDEAWARARAAATKAIEIDEANAEAHAALALFKSEHERDIRGAFASHRRAIELNPSYATGRVRYAWLLFAGGRLNEAVEQMRRGQELDPVSPVTNGALGNLLYYARQYDDSIRYCARALELDPNVVVVRFHLIQSYAMKGMAREASAEAEKLRAGAEVDPAAVLAAVAYAQATAGQEVEARRSLARLLESPAASPVNVAMVYAALGERDEAFRRIESRPASQVARIILRYDPMLDSLRPDPRFREYLRRSDLERVLDWPRPRAEHGLPDS